jgi:hypothetical protein
MLVFVGVSFTWLLLVSSELGFFEDFVVSAPDVEVSFDLAGGVDASTICFDSVLTSGSFPGVVDASSKIGSIPLVPIFVVGVTSGFFELGSVLASVVVERREVEISCAFVGVAVDVPNFFSGILVVS